MLLIPAFILMPSPYGPSAQAAHTIHPTQQNWQTSGPRSNPLSISTSLLVFFPGTDRPLHPPWLLRRGETRRKTPPGGRYARAPSNKPHPRHKLRNPNSLVYSLSQGEEPWLAASLRPANFLPGLAIGFLLGLLLDLSSSWRPKSSSPPAPAAAPARGSSSKWASGSSFASGGEELKMVSCAASVPREYT